MLSSIDKRFRKWKKDKKPFEGQSWEMGDVYQDVPVDTSQRHTRLLELLPGRPDSPLSGRLFVASLDQNPEYEAVSYVWGDQSEDWSITLNRGVDLRIGRNLHHALVDLRNPKTSITLWTDAICIQQDSEREQNHQVQMMAQIYSQSKAVRAWIDYDINLNSEIFQKLPDVVNSANLRADNGFWSPAVSLLQNAYWRRLWIQQELILSRDIIINCRSRALDPRITEWLLDLPRAVSVRARNYDDRRLYPVDQGINGDYVQPIFGGIKSARSVRSRRAVIVEELDLAFPDHFNTVGWASLLTLFLDTHRLETTEQKDRVYGMLGLATDVKEGDVIVEYNIALASVYAKVPEMFLHKHRFLMFLCHETQIYEFENLPTWLPAPERKSVIIWSCMNLNPNYASNRAWGTSIRHGGRCLSVRGVRVSKISRVYAQEDFRLTNIPEWVGYLKDYLARKKSPGLPGHLWEDEEILYIVEPWFNASIFKSLQIPGLDKRQLQMALRKLIEISELSQYWDLRLVDTQTTDLHQHATAQEVKAFRNVLFAFQNQLLFETLDYRLGTVFYLSPVQPEDEIWCLYGSPLPMILRPQGGSSTTYTWIGFVRNMAGLMKGEGFAGFPTNDAPVGFTHQGRRIESIDIW